MCDSALVVDRRVTAEQDGATVERTLEFGVSGLLMHSTVILYDRTDQALWSQLLMEAISGPRVGEMLRALPFEVTTWRAFAQAHPDGETIGYENTGFPNRYAGSLYSGLRESNDFMWRPVPNMGKALPPKTLGLGILAGDKAWFVPRPYLINRGPVEIDTGRGIVEVRATEGGVQAVTVPEGVGVAQAFYFGWSAYHPDTIIVGHEP